MFTVKTPFRFFLSAEARRAVGDSVSDAALAAFRELVFEARGFEIAHLQFAFRGATLAVSSRLTPRGDIEITADIGDPARPASRFTEAEYRRAVEASIRRGEEARKAARSRLNGLR